MNKYEIRLGNGQYTIVSAIGPQEAILKAFPNKVASIEVTTQQKGNIKVTLLNGSRTSIMYYNVSPNLSVQSNSIITLYHGSPNAVLKPQYGKGEDKHDYGRGLYFTPDIELAKEWAVCTGNEIGYVYKITIDENSLSVLDFDKQSVLSWVAEIMAHRPADEKSKRYRTLAPLFIKKHKISTDSYDIIKGWRADASYYKIVKLFVRDEINVTLLPKLLQLGDLGVQYCLKSSKAFQLLNTEYKPIETVSATDYYSKYVERHDLAFQKITTIIESKENDLSDVFSQHI